MRSSLLAEGLTTETEYDNGGRVGRVVRVTSNYYRTVRGSSGLRQRSLCLISKCIRANLLQMVSSTTQS